MTRCLYCVTSYSVEHDTRLGMFVVVNEMDCSEEVFERLKDALDYADNGDLSEEALEVLRDFAAEEEEAS